MKVYIVLETFSEYDNDDSKGRDCTEVRGVFQDEGAAIRVCAAINNGITYARVVEEVVL